jgi:hypothetical protein
MPPVNLPAVLGSTAPVLDGLASALGIPRDALAASEDIEHAYAGLPRLLSRVPEDKRNHLLARLCVAVATGLFDSAVNYAWNAAILELREKVRVFGLPVVAQTLANGFDEKALLDLKDAELLELCLKLNLITEDGHFFLDQCREIRNNFSAAHPPIGAIDDHEVLQFLNRCVKYAIVSERNPRGVDTQAFIASLKGARLSPSQQAKWVELLEATHEAQRDLLIGTLHGIYCDPNSAQDARLNAIDLSASLAQRMSPRLRAQLVDRHNHYIVAGDEKRQTASQAFFARLNLMTLLGEKERHGIIARAAQRLLASHLEFNNFYNEPPFAERLSELTSQGAVPESAQFEFVCTVVLCATGNQYGTSWAAAQHYQAMIRRFTPREVAIMLEAAESYPALAMRLKTYAKCREQFRALIMLIEPASVGPAHRNVYEKWRNVPEGVSSAG